MNNVNSEINEALAAIEEWISQLAENRLSGACQVEGREFFRFMQSRGINPAFLASLIQMATGQNPAQLWRVDDIKLLKDAIFRYAASVKTTQIEEKYGIENTARRNVRHFWS